MDKSTGLIETSGGLEPCPHAESIEGNGYRKCVRCGFIEVYACKIHDWGSTKSRYRQYRRCGVVEDMNC